MKKVKLITKQTSRIIAWSVLRDYLYYLSDTKRIIFNNFLSGFFRGIGNAIGFFIIGAVLIYIVTLLASKNLPIIGDILEEILDLIKYRY